MTPLRNFPIRAFRLTLEHDSQAILRALGPFAMAGLTPHKLTLEPAGEALVLSAEFEGLDDRKADWLCDRVGVLPVCRAAEHSPVL